MTPSLSKEPGGREAALRGLAATGDAPSVLLLPQSTRVIN